MSSKKTWIKVALQDYKRLQPEVFLNDTLLDFWLNWITRNESDKDLLFLFSTHNFTPRCWKKMASRM
jgi:Ulp1 family protease